MSESTHLVNRYFIEAVAKWKRICHRSFGRIWHLIIAHSCRIWVQAFKSGNAFTEKSKCWIAVSISPTMRVIDSWRVDRHVSAVFVLNAQSRFPFHPVVKNAKKLSCRVPVKISTVKTQIGCRNPNIVQLAKGHWILNKSEIYKCSRHCFVVNIILPTPWRSPHFLPWTRSTQASFLVSDS